MTEDRTAPALAIIDKVLSRLDSIQDVLIEAVKQIDEIRKEREAWRQNEKDPERSLPQPTDKPR